MKKTNYAVFLCTCSIGYFTTNLAENYMNVWAKFDGDKQKYRSQSEVRCAGAGLRMNEKLTWAPGTWEKIVSTPACAG